MHYQDVPIMMNLQYIADKLGHTTAVQIQIPIADWDLLKQKYKEFEEEENATLFDVPEWQMELGKKELQNIVNGSAGLMSWNESLKQFKN